MAIVVGAEEMDHPRTGSRPAAESSAIPVEGDSYPWHLSALAQWGDGKDLPSP